MNFFEKEILKYKCYCTGLKFDLDVIRYKVIDKDGDTWFIGLDCKYEFIEQWEKEYPVVDSEECLTFEEVGDTQGLPFSSRYNANAVHSEYGVNVRDF